MEPQPSTGPPQVADGIELHGPDHAGTERTTVVRSEARAVREVANTAAGGLTFHQLRHSYATWLVSDGVPVNDVQKLMGHSRASTILDLYTHFRKTLDPRVNDLFADDSLTFDDPGDEDGPAGSAAPAR